MIKITLFMGKVLQFPPRIRTISNTIRNSENRDIRLETLISAGLGTSAGPFIYIPLKYTSLGELLQNNDAHILMATLVGSLIGAAAYGTFYYIKERRKSGQFYSQIDNLPIV